MIEINIRDSYLFKELEPIMGEEKAYSSLLEVVLWKLNRGAKKCNFLEITLVHAFSWEESPQRRSYWSGIHAKIERSR